MAAGSWKAMDEVKVEGKLCSIGISDVSVNIWNKFMPDFVTKPVVNQVEFNLLI